MSIGKTRRELKLSRLSQLVTLYPATTNVELAKIIGVHRNTLARYLQYIKEQEEAYIALRKRAVVSDLLDTAKTLKFELMGLWSDSYPAFCTKNPSQLLHIWHARWEMEKEIARLKYIT